MEMNYGGRNAAFHGGMHTHGVGGVAGGAGWGGQVSGGAAGHGAAAGDAGIGCGVSGTQVLHTADGRVGSLPAGARVEGFAGAGCNTGCLAEECATGNGLMAFVGVGGGDYVAETTYRFVGDGQGDVRFVAEKRRTYCGLALCLMLVVGLILLLMMRPQPTTTTAAPVTVEICQREDCSMKFGPDRSRCDLGNTVKCCLHDTCYGTDGRIKINALECMQNKANKDACCAGNDGAPQCGCQPMRNCAGASGSDLATCQQTNNAHCCIATKCQDGVSCNGDAGCRQCEQTNHQTCCTGNPGAPGCAVDVGRCIFWGDPHIVTWDGARPSFYGDGEFWIVKNKNVFIQGRYMGTKYTYGLAATNKVVIGGPFLKGHTIRVEPMENGGQILVDGRAVCPNLGCSFSLDGGLATILHDDKGTLVDQAASKFDRHMVHIDLPMNIKLTVFRWTNYIDLDLRMPKLDGGVDGSCGNFNGNAADDSTQQIFQRVGARVGDDSMLFRSRAGVPFSPEEYAMLMTCHVLAQANQTCQTSFASSLGKAAVPADELHACMFDECFGMDEHALHTARTFATPADRKAAGDI